MCLSLKMKKKKPNQNNNKEWEPNILFVSYRGCTTHETTRTSMNAGNKVGYFYRLLHRVRDSQHKSKSVVTCHMSIQSTWN